MNALTPLPAPSPHGGRRPGAGTRPTDTLLCATESGCATPKPSWRQETRLDTRDVLKKITRFLDGVAIAIDHIEHRLTHLETRDAA